MPENSRHGHEILNYSDDGRHDIDEAGHHALMTDALKELLIEKGLITADDIT